MRWLLLVLLVKVVVLGWIIGNGAIGLSPDEAQYWTWSQELDWGYYSKPPGIAWQIGLTTALLGNTTLGVRGGALVMGILLSLAVFGIARTAQLEKKTAVWAGIITAVSPLGIYLSFAATTDGAAILFLTLATWVVIRGPNYLQAGLCILVGALFKWTAFVFWPVVLPFLFFFKEMRKWSVIGGIALSLLALIPSIYWNLHHDWATFKHVGAAVGESKRGNFIDFLGAQIGLISPIYFGLLIASYMHVKGRRLWLAASFPALVLVYLALAFFKKMQPNWAAYLYPPGFALIAWVACEKLKRGKAWLYAGTAFATLVAIILFTIPWVQSTDRLPIPYKLNPFRQSVGWEKLPDVLTQAGYNPEAHFLFSDKYQNVSLLSFYAPQRKRAYYFNISETRKTQFSYWPHMQEKESGKTGFFVVLQNMPESDAAWYITHYQNRLQPYFEHIVYKGAFPLYYANGIPVKFALIFECKSYSSLAPKDPEKY